MLFTEEEKRAMRSLFDRVKLFFRRIAEWLRPVFRRLIQIGKTIKRYQVRALTVNPDRRVAAAAKIWLRTKNRRIKRKQLRLLFPQEGW